MKFDVHLISKTILHVEQDGANDCGLFAIAFALHAALGDKVEELEFDQCAMRKHVLECLLNDCFMPFPH